MNNFYDYFKFRFDEVIKLSSASRVRRAIRKSGGYSPGTFGIELEFPADVNEGVTKRDLRNPSIPNDVLYNHADNIKILRKILVMNNQEVEGEEGSETTWGIGPDVSNTEVRSKYLTTKDIPDLLNILEEIKECVTEGIAIYGQNKRYLSLSPSCSAHVHIGLQHFDDMNAFDALATLNLIDEESAYEVAGADRDIRWTKDRGTVLNVIMDQLYTKGIIKKDFDLSNIIVSDSVMRNIFDFSRGNYGLSKYGGTNLKSFVTNGTIEFRYLSSEIINNPKKFIEMIQYYLMLPRLARSKMQIKFTENLRGVFSQSNISEVYFTRMSGNRIRISDKPVPYEKGNISDTRKQLPPSLMQRFRAMKEQRIVDYLKDRTVGDLRDYLLRYLEENEVPYFTFSDNYSKYKYAENNNLNRTALWLGSKFRSVLNIVNQYKNKKLSDITSNTHDQPFNGGLSSLGEIVMSNNYRKGFEGLYTFLYDIRAFG